MSTRRWVLTPRITAGFSLAFSLLLGACLGGLHQLANTGGTPVPPGAPRLSLLQVSMAVAAVLGAVIAAATLIDLNGQLRRRMAVDEERERRANAEAAREETEKRLAARARADRELRATLATLEEKTRLQAAGAEREARRHVAERAQAQAEAANLVKDEFLAVLSHELRSPLHAMLGWLAILKKGASAGRNVDRAVETIERNVRLQARLVDDLLDVSRIVSDKLVIEEEPVDLAVVVHTTVDNARPAAEAKGVELSCSVSPPPGPVVGDEKRLHQMVGNLLANAVKFTPRGGRVSVALVSRGGEATLQVADTGSGIAPEFLPRVFDRFRQADASSTRTHGGLGLGLAIVKRLAELHGGRVEAKSEGPGRGATFTVKVPLRLAPRELPAAPTEAEDPQGGLAGMTVLLLEDDPDGREALGLAIEQTGARVYACGSAAEARRVLDEVIPDVIVSDIGMPGENGYEFLRTLRARGEARVPAIAITGFASKQDREEAARSGFDEHVAKPVNVDVLLGKLRAMVRRSGVGPDGGDPQTPAPAGGPPSGVIARSPQRQAAGSSPPPGGA